MATSYDQALSTVQNRGYGKSDLDRFLATNPGDIGRVGTAFPSQGGGSSASSGGGSSDTPTYSTSSYVVTSGTPNGDPSPATPAPAAAATAAPAAGGLPTLTPSTATASSPSAPGQNQAMAGLMGAIPSMITGASNDPTAANVAGQTANTLRSSLSSRKLPDMSSPLMGLMKAY